MRMDRSRSRQVRQAGRVGGGGGEEGECEGVWFSLNEFGLALGLDNKQDTHTHTQKKKKKKQKGSDIPRRDDALGVDHTLPGDIVVVEARGPAPGVGSCVRRRQVLEADADLPRALGWMVDLFN